MIETLIEWEIGDWSGDGHGQVDTRIIAVGHPEGTIALQELKKAEDAIADKYDIHLETWFSNYKNDYIYPKDAEKLQKLGIVGVGCVPDVFGGIPAIGTADYFDIWRQLIEKVDPTITIREVQYPVFRGRCSGYGLF